MKRNKKAQKSNIKMRNTSKKIILMPIILILVLVIIVVSINLINNKKHKSGNNKKEDIIEYGGMIFNQEMNLSNINLIESGDETPIQVPVPKGYTASSVERERKVNGGFVIYEGEEEVTEANLEEAKKTRNQYVWIPIEEALDMYYTNNTTKKFYGAYYEFTSTGYTRKANATVEPSLRTTDKESTNLIKYMNGITRDKFLKEMQIEFYEMLKSVETYGGFYIGRYESGNVKQNIPVVKKMNTDIHTITWYDSYKKGKRVSGVNDKVVTNMIWGIQFDETLKWLIDTGAKTNEEIATNSTTWGNYYNATFEYTNASGGTATKSSSSQTRIPTGSTEYTVANNIYDLAGNVREWTMEGSRSGSDGRYGRGGGYDYGGTSFPASYRYHNYGPSYSNYDLRFQGGTLYKVALSLEGDEPKQHRSSLIGSYLEVRSAARSLWLRVATLHEAV